MDAWEVCPAGRVVDWVKNWMGVRSLRRGLLYTQYRAGGALQKLAGSDLVSLARDQMRARVTRDGGAVCWRERIESLARAVMHPILGL